MKRKRLKTDQTPLGIHVFFIFVMIVCILPVLLTISASLTSSAELSKYGFKLVPHKIDFSAYSLIFENMEAVLRAYGVTIYTAGLGCVLGTLVTAMTAYPLARANYKLKGFVTFFLYFPTLFNGGLTATYIVTTQYLHLTDNLWVLILPYMVNAFNIFMVRTYYQSLPPSLFEAAQLDGASEIRICFTIAMRLSKPIIATIAFLTLIARWNEWYGAQLYIRDSNKIPLMYLLQRIMMESEALHMMMEKTGQIVDVSKIPGDSLKMAYLVVIIGPMMVAFPFFQKYFVRGMVVGSVKG